MSAKNVPAHEGNEALSSSHSSYEMSTRRRRSPPISLHLQNLSMPLSPSLSITDDDNDEQNESEHESCAFSNDDEVMTPKSCALSISKTKVICMGQVLSLVLALTGAMQSSLHLDCNLSAPFFCMCSFYTPLCMLYLTRLILRERSHRKMQLRQRPSQSEISPGEMKGQRDNQRIKKLRARFEKRNCLLSRWSVCHPDAGGQNENSQVLGERKPRFVGKRHTRNFSLCGLVSIQSSPLLYLGVATADVYANYTTILAFKYTTITNVSLFDALAIPSAMVVSRFFFGRRYTRIHFLGVFICGVGVSMNILLEYEANKERSGDEDLVEEIYPHKMMGDTLAIIGGLLFGVDNTLQEIAVRDWGSLEEYLGAMTFFSAIITFVQALVLERENIGDFFRESSGNETCPKAWGALLYAVFVLGCMLQYLGISSFLRISDAAFLNLSLLTGDAWAVCYAIFAENIYPTDGFYLALLITVSGVVVYEAAPSVHAAKYFGEAESQLHASAETSSNFQLELNTRELE